MNPAPLQVSFGGLGLKVTDAQLHEAARSMLADAIAVKRGVPIAIARESVCSSGGSTPIETASSGVCCPSSALTLSKRAGACFGPYRSSNLKLLPHSVSC